MLILHLFVQGVSTSILASLSAITLPFHVLNLYLVSKHYPFIGGGDFLESKDNDRMHKAETSSAWYEPR